MCSGGSIRGGVFSPNDLYSKALNNPVIPLGTSGQWDDFYVYSPAVLSEGGNTYMLYGGTRDFGANPRIEMEIGLALSTDNGRTFVKQGKVIDRDDVPALGIAPFSILKMGSTYYLFATNFNNTGTTYKACFMTSSDLVTWGSFTLLDGLDASSHSPFVIEDPSDPDQLVLYYTSMVDSGTHPTIKRAVAAKSDPSSWTQTGTVLPVDAIYPCVRFNGEFYEMFYSRPNPVEFRLFKTISANGLTFPDTSREIVPPGNSGAFDSGYLTTPFAIGNLLYYSGRTVSGTGYIGIGLALLE